MTGPNALSTVQGRRRRPKRNELAQPFLKWAGGKRQLLSEIRKLYPKVKISRYYEPFLGAGAVLFDLQPKKATISDSNAELINCYRVIKTQPSKLISIARDHAANNSKSYYYSLRSLDRSDKFSSLSDVERAARIIYLNKTCFNGLFRVNSQGQFNVPFGDYKNPKVLDAPVLKAINHYLNNSDVAILNCDFEEAVRSARNGSFIYFDPPYDPVSDTASFTGYDLNNFDRFDQQRLKALADKLSDRGCKILLSNSATDFIRELYNDTRYEIVDVEASRNINSVGSKRSKVGELLIYNKYDVRGE